MKFLLTLLCLSVLTEEAFASSDNLRAKRKRVLTDVPDIDYFFEKAGFDERDEAAKPSTKRRSKNRVRIAQAFEYDLSMPAIMPVVMPVVVPPPVAAPTLTPTRAPVEMATSPPTRSPVTSEMQCQEKPRDEAMFDVLSAVTSGAELADPATPQGRAYEWILNGDRASLDPCTYPTVEQRYALATVYYGLNGDNWETNIGWLSGAQECFWQMVECDPDTDSVIELQFSKYHTLVNLKMRPMNDLN